MASVPRPGPRVSSRPVVSAPSPPGPAFPPIPFSAVLEVLADVETRGDPSVSVLDVVHDSRSVTPGALFCCVPGTAVDGHDLARAALDAGAAALLV